MIYVFVLAAILFVLVWPLKPQSWSYRNVLIFVTLTAPPAVLYAIPVELFTTPSVVRATNAWFLAVVAAWRVALYAAFLRRLARLSWIGMVVATLLPLVLIVFALALLNLEHVVFELMSGNTASQASPNDDAYLVVILLSIMSFYAAPILLGVYLILVAVARWPRGGKAAGVVS